MRFRPAIGAAALLLAASCCSVAFSAPIRLKGTTFEPARAVVLSQADDSQRHWIVQFDRPISTTEHLICSRSGASVISYIPENALLVSAPPSAVKALRSHAAVTFIGPYLPEYRIDPDVPRNDTAGLFSILCFEETNPASFAGMLKLRRLTVQAQSRTRSGHLFIVNGPASDIRGLVTRPEVRWIEPHSTPEFTMNVARDIIQVEQAWSHSGLYGENQVVAIADSGLDVGATDPGLHPDFAGRIASAFSLGPDRDGATDDPRGHGTHVAGIVAGSGLLSGSNPDNQEYTGSFAGVAPEAELVIQSLLDASGNLGGIPPDIGDLFQQAFDAGARVHTNSWGTPLKGQYDLRAQQLDTFVWGNPDMLILFAAGNEGVDADSNGVTDTESLGAPAAAKNCIAVGASESLRLSGGLQSTYGTGQWAPHFIADPIGSDHISDNPDGMAAWSSRGPTKDGRIKPDIVAPGTNIISTRSHHPAAGTSWGEYNGDYIYSGGTSMATPMVAGAAALVRQYYVESASIEPSAALMKATLLCSAVDMTPGQYGTGSYLEIPPRPNPVEGWGRLDVARAVAPLPPLALDYVDERAGATTGQMQSYTFQVVDNSVPLRVMLVWSDYPSDPSVQKNLVNDLDLTIHAPDAQMFAGNGSPDRTNNVEAVTVETPLLGEYTVKVSAFAVPQGPQPYAIVVLGGLPRSYIAGTITTGIGVPVPGITVSATSDNTTFSSTTDDLGRYVINAVPGDYQVTPAHAGWSFAPPSANVQLDENGVSGVDFSGSAVPASISGTVSQQAIQQIPNFWESPHPYPPGDSGPITISGPDEAVRIRIHFTKVDMEAGYDYVRVRNASGVNQASYTGLREDFWTPWIDGNLVQVSIDADQSGESWGWKVDRLEVVVPGAPLSGAVVEHWLSGATAVTGTDGTYTFASVLPLPSIVDAHVDGYMTRPVQRKVSPAPGENVAGQDFVAIPNPPMVNVNVQHLFAPDLVITVGVGDPENPIWSQVIYDREPHSLLTLELSVPVDAALPYFPPSPQNPWFLTVCDEARNDGGTIQEFSVSRGGFRYPAHDLPRNIPDPGCATVVIPSLEPVRLPAVRDMGIATQVQAWNKVVSAVLDGRIYVQEQDRSSGLAVSGGYEVQPGDIVSIKGMVEHLDCETTISGADVLVQKSGNPSPVPLAMTLSTLGGQSNSPSIPAIPDALGVYNVGLLVRVTGRITQTDGSWFYISDGSGLEDGTGYQGVRVLTGSVPSPTVGSLVQVVGISGCEDLGFGPARVLRLRSADDIHVLDPAMPVFYDGLEYGSLAWEALPGISIMLLNDFKSVSGRNSLISRQGKTEAAVHYLSQGYSTNVGASAWFFDFNKAGAMSQVLEISARDNGLRDRLSIGLHTPTSSTHYSVYTLAEGWRPTQISRKEGWVKFGIRQGYYTGAPDDVRFLVDGLPAAYGTRSTGSGITEIVIGNKEVVSADHAYWDDIIFGWGQ